MNEHNDERAPEVLYRAETIMQAEFLCQRLQQLGFDAMVTGDSATSLWGDQSSPLAHCEVIVPHNQLNQAKEHLDTLLAEHADSPDDDTQ